MSRKETIQQTRQKRKSQTCKVYQIKIDYSKLSKSTRNHLKSLFLEGKWLYNHILSTTDILNFDTKVKNVPVKIQDIFEDRELKSLSSQMKQAIKDRMFQSILNLSAKKKSGVKVGRLKFVSNFSCVPLKQYNNTYKIYKERNRIKLQGLKQELKVSGLNQIPDSSEIANANLVKSGNDYYFHITTYEIKVEKHIPDIAIGIDFGCESQLTLSNGVKLKFEVPVTNRLKRLDRKLQKKVNGKTGVNRKSKNQYKLKIQRQKEYQNIVNKKKDIKNKIVSCLTNNFKTIVFQDENIKAWHSGTHGKKIQNTSIGGIIRDLKHKSHTPIIVDRFFPSTQLCPNCKTKNKLKEWDRIYSCSCGFTEDRDIKSAQCILNEGLKNNNFVPTERREFKPGEIETSVSTIFSNLENIVDVSFCRNKQLLNC